MTLRLTLKKIGLLVSDVPEHFSFLGMKNKFDNVLSGQGLLVVNYEPKDLKSVSRKIQGKKFLQLEEISFPIWHTVNFPLSQCKKRYFLFKLTEGWI